MLTCKEMSELVTEYLEGNMSFWKRLKFRLHARMCPPCVNYLEQMRLTQKTLGSLPDEPIPEDVESALLEHFRDWKRE